MDGSDIETSVCRICRELKPLDQFYATSKKRCKACSRSLMRKWQLKNPEKQKEYQKKRGAKPEYKHAQMLYQKRRVTIMMQKRIKDPSFNVTSSKICSLCKIEKISEDFYYVMRQASGLSSACRACSAARQALLRERPDYDQIEKAQRVRRKPIVKGLRLLSGARRRSLEKGRDFDLDLEWLSSRLDICELSGIAFEEAKESFKPMSASIDRIDASRGYTKDNCRVICYALNAAFNQWGSDAFEVIARAWLGRLANA